MLNNGLALALRVIIGRGMDTLEYVDMLENFSGLLGLPGVVKCSWWRGMIHQQGVHDLHVTWFLL